MTVETRSAHRVGAPVDVAPFGDDYRQISDDEVTHTVDGRQCADGVIGGDLLGHPA